MLPLDTRKVDIARRMADSKLLTPPHSPAVTELSRQVHDLAQTDSPRRLLHSLCKATKTLTNTSAAACHYGPDGQIDFTVEQFLATAQRGQVNYPDRDAPATPS